MIDPLIAAADSSAILEIEPRKMAEKAEQAVYLLKILSHSGRLILLCHLISGPKTVNELANRVQLKQDITSLLLTRLRLEGTVNTRREGKSIYYSIADPKAVAIIASVYDTFCSENGAGTPEKDQR